MVDVKKKPDREETSCMQELKEEAESANGITGNGRRGQNLLDFKSKEIIKWNRQIWGG